MRNNFNVLIVDLCINSELNDIINNVFEYWGGDFEGMWGVFFSDIGKKIVDINGNQFFYDKIEDFLDKYDKEIVSLITTCTLEETYKRANEIGNWNLISEMLGRKCKAYIDDWNQMFYKP